MFCIARNIGTYDTFEVTSTAARVRVFIDGLHPLIRKTTLEFDDGQEVEASLLYEKLHNHCTTCYSLCHSKEECTVNQPAPLDAPEDPQRFHKSRRLTRNSTEQNRTVQRPVNEPQNSETNNSRGYYDYAANRVRIRNDIHSGSYNLESARYNRRSVTHSESYRDRNPPSTE